MNVPMMNDPNQPESTVNLAATMRILIQLLSIALALAAIAAVTAD